MRVGIVCRSQIDYALDLANELEQNGQEVVLYLDEQHLVDEAGDAQNPVGRLLEIGMLSKNSQVRKLTPPRMRDLRSFYYFWQIARTIQSDGVDVVHILLNPAEIWYAMLAAFVRKCAVVSTIIVPVANKGDRLLGWVIWAVNKLAAINSDMLIVNGEDQVAQVSHLFGFPAGRIAYVPLSMHSRAGKWQTKELNEPERNVLFFGRAHPHKGLQYLIQAQPLITQRVPDAKFILSAHGEDLKDYLRKIVNPDKFELIEGFVPGDKMAELFQRAALVALPYLTASTSGVLVTAYSFGKPVVASRVGCLSEYVEDGVTGLLVEPGEVEELADAIVRLLQDDDLRRQMSENAVNWIKDMQKGLIEKTVRVYALALSHKYPAGVRNFKG